MSGSSLTQKVAQWPTPSAMQDTKGDTAQVDARIASGKQVALAHRARSYNLPDQPKRADGPTFSARLRISRQLRAYVIALHGRATWRRPLKGRAARRLNPLFVEWLMGWPEGHALCGASETAFTRWQQDMRGALSQLPMASAPWIWSPPTEAEAKPMQMGLF